MLLPNAPNTRRGNYSEDSWTVVTSALQRSPSSPQALVDAVSTKTGVINFTASYIGVINFTAN